MFRVIRHISHSRRFFKSTFQTHLHQTCNFSGTSVAQERSRTPTAEIVDPVRVLPEPGCGPDDSDILLTPKQWGEMRQVMKREFQIWKKEWKENLKFDPDCIYDPGIVYKIYDFSKDKDIDMWNCTSDSNQGFGYSSCTWTKSPNGRALFSGNLSLKLPNDGKTARTGFCAINGPRAMKSFLRKDYYDWSQYTHLVFKVRGDGRSYMVNLGEEGFFDISWYRSHSYVLHTRGGPYWQFTKLPFSKFIYTSQGSIQPRHDAPLQDEITSLGLTICDDIEGPFSLEIDYIGLEIDFSHDEKCAYEYYKAREYKE